MSTGWVASWSARDAVRRALTSAPATASVCARERAHAMSSSPLPRIPLGESAELIADKHKISREQQDKFALHSHHKAARARAEALFDAELAPVPVPRRKGDPVAFAADECVPPDPPPTARPPTARVHGGGTPPEV